MSDMTALAATLPKFYHITGGLPTPTPWLPETAVNGYTITHQTLPPQFPCKLIRGGFAMFDTPLTLSVLRDPSGAIWMSDSPSEILDALDLIPLLPDGDILIGGVGIGLIPWLIHHHRPGITHMTLVDINPVAYQLAKPRLDELGGKVTLVTADFREYLQTADLYQFDGVLMDIWGSLDFDRDLRDMMELWEAIDVPGAIWGADLCVKGLADLFRLSTQAKTVDVLHKLELPELAQMVAGFDVPPDQWLERCYPTMVEAATAVYLYPFINLDESLSATLRFV